LLYSMLVVTYADMLNSTFVRNLIDLALAEDLAYGDVTSSLVVPFEQNSQAEIIAREPLIVCGLPLIELILKKLDAGVAITIKAKEGEKATKGDVLAELKGNTRALLAAERTMLNFIQRLSGIALHTNKIVSDASEIAILDTRKTTPGWRVLEKYAVRTGGGRNHRTSLGDMILIKNNHFDAATGIAAVMEQVMRERPPYMTVEVEVRNMEELKQVVPFKPEVIMCDNMPDKEIVAALNYIKSFAPQTKVEVSGGLEPEDISRLHGLGVKYVSMGSLIKRAVNVDISMRISK